MRTLLVALLAGGLALPGPAAAESGQPGELPAWSEREDAELRRGRVAFARGRIAEAERLWSRLVARQPDHLRARLYRARARVALHQLETAAGDYAELMRRRPGPEVALEAADILAERGDGGGAAAVALLERALAELGPVPGLTTRLRELAGSGPPGPRPPPPVATGPSPEPAPEPTRRRAERFLGPGEALAVTRGPYLQALSASRAVLRWRTNAPTRGRVLLGERPDALERGLEGPFTRDHAIVIGDLAADTRYFYAVGDAAGVLAGADESHRFHTAPRPGSRANVQLWASGARPRAGGAARASVRAREAALVAELADAWLLADPLAERALDAELERSFFTPSSRALRRLAVWPVFAGAQGERTSAALQVGPWFDVLSLPRRGEAGGLPSGTEAYYSFDLANVHVVALDSRESRRDRQGAMLRWLEADLAATDQDWIIAYWYDAPFGGSASAQGADMRRNALPLLEAFGVDLVLTGAGARAARSTLLSGPYEGAGGSGPWLGGGDGCPCEELCSICALGGDGPYRKSSERSAEAVHVVLGASTDPPAGGDSPLLELPLVEPGGLLIDVDGLRLSGLWVDLDGRVHDRFILTKPEDPTPPGVAAGDLGAGAPRPGSPGEPRASAGSAGR